MRGLSAHAPAIFRSAGQHLRVARGQKWVNVFLYNGAIVPDPHIITGGHDNKTARTVAIRQGETINARAHGVFKQIIAINQLAAGDGQVGRGRLSSTSTYNSKVPFSDARDHEARQAMAAVDGAMRERVKAARRPIETRRARRLRDRAAGPRDGFSPRRIASRDFERNVRMGTSSGSWPTEPAGHGPAHPWSQV